MWIFGANRMQGLCHYKIRQSGRYNLSSFCPPLLSLIANRPDSLRNRLKRPKGNKTYHSCTNIPPERWYKYIKAESPEAWLPAIRWCDPGEARTLDPVIKSHLLYQLSYGVIFYCWYGAERCFPLLLRKGKGFI